jgi:hypothetical protein
LNFESGEGCNLHGHVTVNKVHFMFELFIVQVAGNFHFAPGRSFHLNHMHVHDINAVTGILDQFDFGLYLRALLLRQLIKSTTCRLAKSLTAS